MKINLSNVEGGGMEPGIHNVRIMEVKHDVAAEKELIRVQFMNLSGAKQTETYWLSDKALWRLKRLAIACGIKDMENFDTENLVGCELEIQVAIEEYQGKSQTKVIAEFPTKKGFSPSTIPDFDKPKKENKNDSDPF